MAQLAFIKSSNTTLIPASPDTGDFLHHIIKIGVVLHADFKKVRNPEFHRLYFSLLNLGFEYWTPTGGTISPDEKSLIRDYLGYLINLVAHDSIILEYETDYLKLVMKQRADRVTLLKSFDAFRRWMAIQPGDFQLLQMPDGAIIKGPRSISFANMDDTEFAELYKVTLNVFWYFILNKTFSTPAVAENAASQLLSYA